MNIQKPSHRKCQLGGVKWIALFADFWLMGASVIIAAFVGWALEEAYKDHVACKEQYTSQLRDSLHAHGMLNTEEHHIDARSHLYDYNPLPLLGDGRISLILQPVNQIPFAGVSMHQNAE